MCFRVFQKLKKRGLALKSYGLLSIFCISFLVVSCSTDKENQDILVARKSIVTVNNSSKEQVDYSNAKKAVESALASVPDSVEAMCLKEILSLHSESSWTKDIDRWKSTIIVVQKMLSPLETGLQQLQVVEDPDSDQLDLLDLLIHSRNSVYSLIAYGLSDLFSGDIDNGGNVKIDSSILRSLLEAQRCYNYQAKRLAFETINQFGMRVKTQLLDILSMPISPEVRQYAISHLANLADESLVETYTQILANKQETNQVLYSTVVALEKIGSKKVIPALKAATRSNSAIVRMHAAKLVHRLNSSTSVVDLMYLLADSDSYVKSTAISALNQIGQPAMPNLVQTLDQNGENIVGSSFGEHQFIANAFIDNTRTANRRSAVQRSTLQILGDLKIENTVKILIQLLANDELKASARNALIKMGGKVVPQLIQTCQNMDASVSVRVESARALLSMGDLRATEPLIDLLLDLNTPKEIQGISAQFMGNTLSRGKDLRAVKALGYALELDDSTAIQAASALGKLKIKDNGLVNKQLIRIAENTRGARDAVRKATIDAIGELGLTEAIQPLLRLSLSDTTSLEIRKSSVLALGKIENNVSDSSSAIAMLWGLSTRFDDPNKLRRHMKRKYKTYARLSESVDKLGVEWLPNSEHFRKPQYESWGKIKPVPSLIRSEIAVTLGKIGKKVEKTAIGQNIVAELIGSLHHKTGDERATVRANSAASLGVIGENRGNQKEQIVKALTQALEEDRQGLVRQAAATALGKVDKSERVTKVLVKALNEDEFESTRTNVVKALATFGQATSADQELVKVLKKGIGSFEDDEKEVASIQSAVMDALVQDGVDKTALALSKANDSSAANADKWVKWAIISTLGRLKNPNGFAAVLKETRNANYRIRKTAVSLIGNFNNRDAVDRLLEIANSNDESKTIRANAIRSLGKLRYEGSVGKILEILQANDVETEIKEASIFALQSMKIRKAVTPILSLINDMQSPSGLRLAGVKAIGFLGDSSDESVVNTLSSIFQNETGEIYETAISVIGKVGLVQFSDDFLSIVADRGATPHARQNAALSLSEFGVAKTSLLLEERLIDSTEYFIETDIDLVRRNYTWEAFVNAAQSFELSDKIDEWMIRRIDDSWESSKIRDYSILALGRSKSKSSANKLGDLLKNNNLSAMLAVGRSGKKEFLPLLIEKIDVNQDKAIRRKSIEAVGLLGDNKSLPNLISLLDDTDAEIRQDVINALSNIKDPSVIPSLARRLSIEEQASVKAVLVVALANLGATQSVSSIEPLLQTENADLYFQVAQSLYQITGNSHGYGWE